MFLMKKYMFRTLSSPAPISNIIHEEACDDEQQQALTLPPELIPNLLFPIGQEKLNKLVEANNIKTLDQEFSVTRGNGIHELLRALDTDVEAGISADEGDLYRRRLEFGLNNQEPIEEHHPISPSSTLKCFRLIAMEAFKDTTVIFLLLCATLSLVIGIKRNGPQEGFVDGLLIFLAIFLAVNFGVIFRHCMIRRMRKKMSLTPFKKPISVLRSRKIEETPVSEVLVGDIVCLKSGDQIPADGLFLNGSDSFKLEDDDAITKSNGFSNGFYYYNHPSMFSGSKVARGECRMVVTSVGMNTEKSRLTRLMTSSSHDKDSKFHAEIQATNKYFEKISLSLSLLVLVVQIFRCFVLKQQCDRDHDPDPKGLKDTMEEMMDEATKLLMQKKNRGGGVMRFNNNNYNRLVSIICILILAMRDGLPLGIFVYLAFASKNIMSTKTVLLRKLSACARLGQVATVCIDTGKSGDLAFRSEKMAELWIGLAGIFKQSTLETKEAKHVLNVLRDGIICMNTSFSGQDLGHDDDIVLFHWARSALDVEMCNLEGSILHKQTYVDHSKPSLMIVKKDEKIAHAHWKGDPGNILSMCSHYFDVDGTMQTLDEEKKGIFRQMLAVSVSLSSDDHTLRSFAFSYKRIHLDVQEQELGIVQETTLHNAKHGLTLLGIVRLKNPVMSEVRNRFNVCREEARVNVKLMVDDVDINTARIMAIYSGILMHDDMEEEAVVIDAKEFRNATEEDRMKMVSKIKVMVNSSNLDKLLLVKCLRKKGGGEVVAAVTGICNRDGPFMEESDVGIFMGSSETTSAADILVSGINFAACFDLIEQGRFICNNLKKFIQLQLILNVVAFALNIIVVVITTEVPLGSLQLLWVNIFMDILGAWALAVELLVQVKEHNHKNTSEGRKSQLPLSKLTITKTMWKNIVVQCLYQITALVILELEGKTIFHVNDTVLEAMTFNCYVLFQVFMLLNVVIIEKTDGLMMKKKIWFVFMVGMTLILHSVAAEVVAIVVADEGRLDLKQWFICIGIASTSVPISWATNCWISCVT